MSIEIYFLGTSSGLPSVERGMPSIALRKNGKVYLFDAGENCQRQLMKHKTGYGSIEAIFISHLHLDHFLGIFGLIETLRMTTEKKYSELKIFAPKGFEKLLFNNWKFLKIKELKQGVIYKEQDLEVKCFKVKHIGDSYGFVFEEGKRRKFNAEKAHKLGIKGELFSKIQEKKSIALNGKRIKLSEVSNEINGKKIVYTGDTAYSENTVKFAKNADVLIHEATFGEENTEKAVERNHSTVKDAATIAKKANVKTLVLTHISARYKDEKDIQMLVEQAKKYFSGKIIIAYDGMKLEI